MNKRWVQTMGFKNFYYNSTGEAIEVNQSTAKLKKRTMHPKLNLKTEASRRNLPATSSKREEKKREDIMVEFKGRENQFRSGLETVVLGEKPSLLFYKSQNCQYKIMK